MSDVQGKNGSSIVLAGQADRQVSAARIIERCDRLAYERLRLFDEESKNGETRISLAEEIVEELADELQGRNGTRDRAKRKPSRSEAIAAEWWRGRDVLARHLDEAGLDEAERDALGVLIGLCEGTQCVGARPTRGYDPRSPMVLMRLVELGHAGPIARESLGPEGRLARGNFTWPIWKRARSGDEPYLVLVARLQFLAVFADPLDTFGYPKPWLRVERPKETLDDLVIPDALRAEIDSLGELCAHAMSGARGRGLEYGRGLVGLFHGPAGTGKTLAARALAGSLGVPLASYDRGRAQELGLDDDKVKEVLERWRPQDGILFIDEVDDILDELRRGDSNALLIGLEAFEGVLLMATNRTLEVRASLDRRIHHVITFPSPDRELRARMIRKSFTGVATLDEHEIERLARHPLSGGLIKNAWLEACAIRDRRGAALAADVVDEALRRQHRSERVSLGDGSALLDIVRQSPIEGLDAALAVLTHAIDPDGKKLRARVGLQEPVIDVVGLRPAALALVNALAGALGFTVEHVVDKDSPRRSTRGHDGDDELAVAPRAIACGGEHVEQSPSVASALANTRDAFAAFRILSIVDEDEDDLPDATVRIDEAATDDLLDRILDARVAEARAHLDDRARAWFSEARTKGMRGVSAARSLGSVLASSATGLAISAPPGSDRRPAGLFEPHRRPLR